MGLPSLVGSEVSAGFPSPADDYLESPLNLHDLLVRHPAATFFVRVSGQSMAGAGILPGDILVVDRSCETRDGGIVVAAVDGEFTVKRLRRRAGRAWLEAAHPGYPPIELAADREGQILWGVVTGLVRERPG